MKISTYNNECNSGFEKATKLPCPSSLLRRDGGRREVAIYGDWKRATAGRVVGAAEVKLRIIVRLLLNGRRE